jgi:predicted dehydrogenase
MTERIRTGVIGTSWWADFGHFSNLTSDARVQVIAICGRNQERAQAMATKYAIPRVFTDYRAMFAEADLQAVVIAAPDDEHFSMTMAALEAGLHVLCEKPLALNATHAKTLYESAEAKGLRHMANFNWRWMPHYRYLRDLIGQGVLGRLYHAQFNFMAGSFRGSQYSWRFDPQRANGVLGDFGSHMFDLAHFLVGDIVRVNARLVSNVRRNGVDGQPMTSACDAATVLAEFANGSQGTIEVSAVARTRDPALEHAVILHGEAGSLTASFGLFSAPATLQMATGNDGFQELTIPEEYLLGVDPAQPLGPQMQTIFRHPSNGGGAFVSSILSGQTCAPSFYAGWQAQRVIDGALASHERRGWVDVA